MPVADDGEGTRGADLLVIDLAAPRIRSELYSWQCHASEIVGCWCKEWLWLFRCRVFVVTDDGENDAHKERQELNDALEKVVKRGVWTSAKSEGAAEGKQKGQEEGSANIEDEGLGLPRDDRWRRSRQNGARLPQSHTFCWLFKMLSFFVHSSRCGKILVVSSMATGRSLSASPF